MIEHSIPLLLPVDFGTRMGMILNMPKMQIYWENIKKHSTIHEVPNSGHLAIDIFEFPKGGWQNMYEKNPSVRIGMSPTTSPQRISRKLFEDD